MNTGSLCRRPFGSRSRVSVKVVVAPRPSRNPKDLSQMDPARRVCRWRAPAASGGLGRATSTTCAAFLADRLAIGETERFSIHRKCSKQTCVASPTLRLLSLVLSQGFCRKTVGHFRNLLSITVAKASRPNSASGICFSIVPHRSGGQPGCRRDAPRDGRMPPLCRFSFRRKCDRARPNRAPAIV